MGDNRSPHWSPAGKTPRGRNDRSDQDADLLAALDGSDVSEPVRAAIDRVLSECRDHSDYVDAIISRYASERERGRGRPIPPMIAQSRRARYTLHLTFPAANPREARNSAAAYAEGLSVLRPELTANVPLLSRADAWNHLEPLFCGAVGPDRDTCAGVPGHPGPHRAAGTAGPGWTDDHIGPAGSGWTDDHIGPAGSGWTDDDAPAAGAPADGPADGR
jgi:hypothetical protein